MENYEKEINTLISDIPTESPLAKLPTPKKSKMKLILSFLLLALISLGVWWVVLGREQTPYKSPAIYKPNPTDATSEQVSKAFKIVTASSTLKFETAGVASESVALADVPSELSKYLSGVTKDSTYRGVHYKNGIYSLYYTTKAPLSENHAKLVVSIDRNTEKLIAARSTNLASMIEIDSPAYQIRIIQDVIEGGLTEVVLEAKAK